MFVRRSSGRFVGSAQQLYDKLREKLSRKQLNMNDLLWAGEDVVQEELRHLCSSCRYWTNRSEQNVLTAWEMDNKRLYEQALDKTGSDLDKHIFAVGQNPKHLWKASTNGIFPAFTATDKILWVRKQDRPLTAREKFSAHGFPVLPELASSLGVDVPWPCL